VRERIVHDKPSGVTIRANLSNSRNHVSQTDDLRNSCLCTVFSVSRILQDQGGLSPVALTLCQDVFEHQPAEGVHRFVCWASTCTGLSVEHRPAQVWVLSIDLHRFECWASTCTGLSVEHQHAQVWVLSIDLHRFVCWASTCRGCAQVCVILYWLTKQTALCLSGTSGKCGGSTARGAFGPDFECFWSRPRC